MAAAMENGDAAPDYSIQHDHADPSKIEKAEDEVPLLIPSSQPEERISIFRIMAITAVMIGIQFSYAVEFTFLTPLLTSLGLSYSMQSIVWLAGPLSGLLVQPIVGIWSDSSTSRWGRRRPFILVGAICTILGMVMLGYGKNISLAILGADRYRPLAIFFTVAGLYIMSFAQNTMQGPARALIADRVPASQQQLANGICSAMIGIASLAANLIGSFPINTIIKTNNQNVQTVAMFTLGIAFMAIGVIPTLLFANEKRYVPPPKQPRIGPKKGNFITNNQTLKALRNMPAPLWKLCLVFFFSWFGYFPFNIDITDYVGRNVYGGTCIKCDYPCTPCNDAYEKGVRMGSLGMALMSAVTMLSGPLMGKLTQWFGIKPVYFVSQVVSCVCFILPIWLHYLAPALVFIALPGFNFAALNAIPFALLSQYVPQEQNGLFMGVMNAFAVVAQTVANLAAGAINTRFHSPAYGIAMGGVGSGIGALLVWIIVVPKKKDAEGTDDENKGLISDANNETATTYGS